MPRVSAGLLMYRIQDGQLQVLLAHPGGPYFKNKDELAWTMSSPVWPFLRLALKQLTGETANHHALGIMASNSSLSFLFSNQVPKRTAARSRSILACA